MRLFNIKKRTKADLIVSSSRIARQANSNEFPNRPDIVFVNHRTNVFNLGDYLEQPETLFQMTPSATGLPVAVVGGGVYGSYSEIKKKTPALDMDGRVEIAWGVGLSRKDRKPGDSPLKELAESFNFISTRDRISLASGSRFAPAPASSTASLTCRSEPKRVFFSISSARERPGAARLLASYEDNYVVGSNAISENDFRSLFGRTSHIVTNSYHTAYSGPALGKIRRHRRLLFQI